MAGPLPTPAEEAVILRSVADRIASGEIFVPDNLWGGAVRRQTEKTLTEPDSESMDQVRSLQDDVTSREDVAESLRRLADQIEE